MHTHVYTHTCTHTRMPGAPQGSPVLACLFLATVGAGVLLSCPMLRVTAAKLLPRLSPGGAGQERMPGPAGLRAWVLMCLGVTLPHRQGTCSRTVAWVKSLPGQLVGAAAALTAGRKLSTAVREQRTETLAMPWSRPQSHPDHRETALQESRFCYFYEGC